MVISISLLTWLLVTVVWGFLALRFRQASKRLKDKVSEFFFYFATFLMITSFFNALFSIIVKQTAYRFIVVNPFYRFSEHIRYG